MTVVAMWCRHNGDDIIGIGKHIPWNVPSDAEHFLEVVDGQVVVCGRLTYESFPNRSIDGCRIFVLTSDENYEVSDEKHHCIISSQKVLADLEDDIYVAGGATVYYLFMTGKEKLKPQIVVDCVYMGEIQDCDGKPISITDSVAVLQKNSTWTFCIVSGLASTCSNSICTLPKPAASHLSRPWPASLPKLPKPTASSAKTKFAFSKRCLNFLMNKTAKSPPSLTGPKAAATATNVMPSNSAS